MRSERFSISAFTRGLPLMLESGFGQGLIVWFSYSVIVWVSFSSFSSYCLSFIFIFLFLLFEFHFHLSLLIVWVSFSSFSSYCLSFIFIFLFLLFEFHFYLSLLIVWVSPFIFLLLFEFHFYLSLLFSARWHADLCEDSDWQNHHFGSGTLRHYWKCEGRDSG